MKNGCGGCLGLMLIFGLIGWCSNGGVSDKIKAEQEQKAEVERAKREFARQYAPELADAIESIQGEIGRRRELLEEFRKSITALGYIPAQNATFVKRQEELKRLTAEVHNLDRVLDELYLTSKALETDPNALDNQNQRAKSIASAKAAAADAQRLLRTVMAESEKRSIEDK